MQALKANGLVFSWNIGLKALSHNAVKYINIYIVFVRFGVLKSKSSQVSAKQSH